jgi:hypothetical protein
MIQVPLSCSAVHRDGAAAAVEPSIRRRFVPAGLINNHEASRSLRLGLFKAINHRIDRVGMAGGVPCELA